MDLDPAKRKKILWIAGGGVLAVALIILAVVLSLESGVEGSPVGTFSGAPVPENELVVSDIYNGDMLIPKFDLPQNKYDAKKLKEKEGFLQYDNTKARLGVDVSEYQGNVDWNAVKESGIDFAILRVGYRGMTQGLLNEDENFEQNYRGARAAGLDVGVYFFSQAVNEEEARAEAEFVLEKLKEKELKYPVSFDWEKPAPSDSLPASVLRAYNVTGEQAAKCGAAFCERIKEGGFTPCVYTNKHLGYQFFDLEQWKEYDLWYAEYQSVPSFYYDFRIWQYTENGQVPGISGGVDMNICFEAY